MAFTAPTRAPLANTHCGVCSSTQNLLRCTGCKVMHYCSREHQVAHRHDHKAGCKGVAKATRRADHEEEKLRNLPPNMFVPPDVFENQVGSFWGILETRDYMRARFAIVKELEETQTRSSVQSQLDVIMDLLRLNRSDNMGARDMVPALMLRLGKDQECYDFLKWWCTTADEADYDWGDMSEPYMDIRNADVFEGVEHQCQRYASLSHTVAATLLKIKILLNFQSLRASYALGETVAPEIVHSIQAHVPRSPTVAANMKIIGHRDRIEELDQRLKVQVKKVYKAADNLNEYFWPHLLNPGHHLTALPEAYSPGSMEEMELALKYSYNSWVEIPGAIDMIKTIRAAIPKS
ncbi:uncharacterized protein BP5553_01088 [Venustampulla echinocandica]|uniref:MYND-type domain-containing protein n=1 Tax=Venustampulla echinocandica TaxID=2656787 RepID=A0A370U006_9HELO|nr:uncharacterized protein BP5553_01088 [Venustampulla echinocandica]RDL41109.1 hypothetical protein BP5553_01088 [Venustampulla echinocandica]